ncbi:MAG: phosphodiesterase [Ruminococcaceae bacterium]|nr:phosphodiesterase [Oscillospiraceae bacterium]
MKLMIASDIHGSAAYCQQLVDAYKKEAPDKLLLLGDLLYHGPRNDLPLDYAPKKVIELLNDLKEAILCVRGNCEAEVDQMVLGFPVLADYAYLDVNGFRIFATHGHLYGETTPPPLAKGDILLCGHTHVPACRDHEGFCYMNPGSVSIPKENSEHSYMILEERTFFWKSLDGTVYKTH